MARPLRVNVAGGWYHLTARGQNRQRIYEDARDYRDFLARLEEMSGRYGLEVHGYVGNAHRARNHGAALIARRGQLSGRGSCGGARQG